MSELQDLRDKTVLKLITPIDEAELACRIVEAAAEVRRPPGATAVHALDALEPEDLAQWRRAARAAVGYFRECIEKANSVQ